MNLFHLFVPHHKNNHRAKILHHVSLVVLILFFSLASSFTILVHRVNPQVLGISYSISEQQLLNLVNYQREQKGLPDLKENEELDAAASQNAQYMFAHDYWAHFAPDGTSPWSFIKKAGYDYVYAGQNLAKGFTTPGSAVDAWMNSPTHRANILSPNFSDVGFAIEEGNLQGEDTVLIVQMFGSTNNSAVVDNNSLVPLKNNNLNLEAPTVPSQKQVAGSSQERSVTSGNALVTNAPNSIINFVFGTKAIIFIILGGLLIALLFDFIVIEKNKIPRVVGNNIDHIILISLFIIFLFVMHSGRIL